MPCGGMNARTPSVSSRNAGTCRTTAHSAGKRKGCAGYGGRKPDSSSVENTCHDPSRDPVARESPPGSLYRDFVREFAFSEGASK